MTATRVGGRRGRFLGTASVALIIALALGACGPRGGLSDRYVAERLAWQAMMIRRAMLDNPDLATGIMRDRLADKYREIVRTFPPPTTGADALTGLERDVATISGLSRLQLAALTAGTGDLREAARLYSSVSDSYAFDRRMAIDASVALAAVHERAGEWPRAVRVYESMMTRWAPADEPQGVPDSRVLRAPLNVASGYLVRRDEAEARQWFDKARDHYSTLASEWEGTPTAEVALALRAETFEVEQRWAEAAAAYEELDGLYGSEANRDDIWLKLAGIYDTRLDRPGRAQDYYLMVERDYAGQVSGATASVELARSDIERGRYEAGRARLAEVLETLPHEEVIGATASYYLALSYELEGQWDTAASRFSALAGQYPTTVFGLSALIHVAEHYAETGEDEAARAAFDRAADHYERVARDYASTPAELAARNYLVDTRLRQEKWREAADVLLETVERFPDLDASPSMMLRAAELHETELEDADGAKRILESLRRTYPDSEAAKEAERRLEGLASE